MSLLLLSGCFVRLGDERFAEAVSIALFGGMVVHHVIEDSRNPRPMPGFSAFSDRMTAPPPAPMAPDRKVSEQDCSKPIDFTLGNIKCK